MGRTVEPGEPEREIIIEPIRRTKPEPKREPKPAPQKPKRKKEPAKK